MLPLIIPDIVAFLAGLAAVLYFLHFLRSRNPMDFGLIIPRLFVCAVYSWFAFDHNLPIETTRVWGRDAIALLFGTEVFYQLLALLKRGLDKHVWKRNY
jgi:hypothetical protein